MKKILERLIVVMLAALVVFTSVTPNTAHAASGRGTKKSPYSLKLGVSESIQIPAKSTVWCEFSTKGAVNLSVQYAKTSFVVIDVYEEKLFSDTKIGYSYIDCNFNRLYEIRKHSTYLVSLTNNKDWSCSVKINASLNQDKVSNALGGIWRPKTDSTFPDASIYPVLCLEKTYYPKEHVSDLYQALSNDNLLNVLDVAVGMTTSAALTYIEAGLGITSLTASMLLSAATSPISLSLTSLSLDAIKEAGGYNSRTNKYSNGVCYSVYSCNGMAFYTYEPWTSNVMCGEEGYTGNFRLNK